MKNLFLRFMLWSGIYKSYVGYDVSNGMCCTIYSYNKAGKIVVYDEKWTKV